MSRATLLLMSLISVQNEALKKLHLKSTIKCSKEVKTGKWPNLPYSFFTIDCCIRINHQSDHGVSKCWYSVTEILIMTNFFFYWASTMLNNVFQSPKLISFPHNCVSFLCFNSVSRIFWFPSPYHCVSKSLHSSNINYFHLLNLSYMTGTILFAKPTTTEIAKHPSVSSLSYKYMRLLKFRSQVFFWDNMSPAWRLQWVNVSLYFLCFYYILSWEPEGR